uniref:Ymf57-like protein n=1 Tax=Thuricola similis TaxID=2784598 RepID=A0A7T8JK27_9CILI|nr:Ymf57-like protein [Thuricola similis]QQP22136.1 Ymf57-like protein [Thuricola similis]
MLAYIFKYKYYRTIKNGLLVDYIIKKFVITTWTTTLIQFNNIFNDKYLIEYTAKLFYQTYILMLNFLTQLQNMSSIYLVNFIVITTITIVLLFNLWLI